MPLSGGASAWVSKGAIVYNDANLSVPNITTTAITLNSETRDDSDFHSTVSNTSRLTVPDGESGWYVIAAHAIFDNSGGGTRRQLNVRLNGTTYVARCTFDYVAAYNCFMALTTIHYLSDNGAAANDYAEMMVYQDSGAALNILYVADASPVFKIAKIG